MQVSPVAIAHSPDVLPPEGGARSGRFYHPELDSLRFFAFLAILFHHAVPSYAATSIDSGLSATVAGWAASAVRSGGFGVDVFLALSAYLITELLIREHVKEGRIDVRSFYIRRALRIWPLYFTFLAIVVFVLPQLLARERLSPIQRAGFFTFLGNWTCAIFGFPPSVAAPLWSISVEEQFYLMWPLLLTLVGIGRIRELAFSLLAVATAARVVLVLKGTAHPGIWCDTFARLDAIACGALLAVVLDGDVPFIGRGRRMLMGTGGVVLLVLAAHYGSFDGVACLYTYPLSAIAAALILLSVLRKLGSAPSVMGSRPLLYLGKISYGLYVFHLLALALVTQFTGTRIAIGVLTARFCLTLVLTIAIGAASYRWLEEPFLKLKSRFTYVSSKPVST